MPNYKRKFNSFEEHWQIVDCGYITSCWLWQGIIHSGGYGQYSINRRLYTAHRVVYEKYKGEIPFGKILDHLCQIKRCVNPEHFDVTTIAVNGQRSKSAVLNAELVKLLRKENSEGISASKLAQKYALKHGTVLNVISGRTWSNI